MTKVNGLGNDGKVPEGYTKVKTYDTKTKETKTFLVPVGSKVSWNNNTYEPSKLKNNEIVFTGTKGQDGFDNIGLALEHMDVNGDGRIDKKDTKDNLAPEINKDLAKNGSKYYVKDVKDVFSDAGVQGGKGGVVFRHEDTDDGQELYIE